MERLTDIIQLLRIKHYIKNLLIFLPILFSGNLTNLNLMGRGMIGFVVFSILCSAVYLINDSIDADKDRLHPVKRNRPIASGRVSKHTALILAIGCIIFSFIIYAICISKLSGGAVLGIYLVENILYCIKFKDIPILDIVSLASGFFFRVLFGSLLTGIPISPWLFLMIISTALCLGLGKRRNELQRNLQEEVGMTRKVLSYYNYDFLDKNMYMCLALANTFYALWASQRNIEGMLWTVPLVMVTSMRYSLVVEGESDGDPVEVLLHDPICLVLLFCYGLAIIWLIYF